MGNSLSNVQQPTRARLDGYRVLVVDDNHDSADSLAMVLRLFGADVRAAYDGIDALSALEDYESNLLILDLNMPAVDGYEVARRIRERPGYRDVLIIALTGWGMPGDRARSQAAGFDYHFMKPLQTDQLFDVLHRPKPRHH